MRFIVGSFNVRNLADGEGRDLDRIASIIKDNAMDVVVLQEVLQEGKILNGIQLKDEAGQSKAYKRSLLSRLGSNWGCKFLQPTIRREHEQYLGGDKRGEGYAVLWNTNRLDLARDGRGKINPKLGINYSPAIAESKLQLIRDPLCVRFKVEGRAVELRIITTHIIYGKPKGADDYIDEGAVKLRKNEFRILAGQIYSRVAEYYKTITAVSPYTLLIGDYNLNLKSSDPFLYPRIPDVVFYDSKGHEVEIPVPNGHSINNYQREKTTLKRDEAELANSYDHVSFDDRTKAAVDVSSIRVIDAIHQNTSPEDTTEEELFKTYKKKVSDHLPIVVEIDIG